MWRPIPRRAGSDALTLTLEALEPGRVAGRIMFGKGPAGPPPNPNSTLGDNSFHGIVCKCDASKCGANDAIVVRFDVVVLGARMAGENSALAGRHT